LLLTAQKQVSNNLTIIPPREAFYPLIHRLNIELDLQSLFGLLCTAVLEFLLFFIFWGEFLFFVVLYSALLHLPPLRFHCADGCWDRTQDRCIWCIDSQIALTTWLDLIRNGIFKQSMWDRNRVGIGLSYQPAESIPWNRSLGSLKV
jgi:hypothetical protein